MTKTNACVHSVNSVPLHPSGGASVDEYECVQNEISYETVYYIAFCCCATSLLLNSVAVSSLRRLARVRYMLHSIFSTARMFFARQLNGDSLDRSSYQNAFRYFTAAISDAWNKLESGGTSPENCELVWNWTKSIGEHMHRCLCVNFGTLTSIEMDCK